MSERRSWETPQLSIDSLNLLLPAGFEGRADAIARKTSRQLSTLPMARSVQLDTVNIPKLRIHGGETNGVIARRIANSIHAQITAATLLNREHKGGRHE